MSHDKILCNNLQVLNEECDNGQFFVILISMFDATANCMSLETVSQLSKKHFTVKNKSLTKSRYILIAENGALR